VRNKRESRSVKSFAIDIVAPKNKYDSFKNICSNSELVAKAPIKSLYKIRDFTLGNRACNINYRPYT